jgi:hypothetical protein
VTIAVSSPSLHSDTSLDTTQLLVGANETLQQALAAGGDCVQGADSQTTTVPRTPAGEILPETETMTPAPPAVASSDDVQRALQALSAGRHPEVSADALARAVLPLLDNWDQALNNRHTTLIEQFKSALESTGEDESVSGASPDSAFLSL